MSYGAYLVPTTASYDPPVFTEKLFELSLRFAITSWTYCPSCGRRRPRDHSRDGLDLLFECPPTMVSMCKLNKTATFKFGCSYDSYRQRDLETNGVNSMHANQSVLDWRREQRSLWNLQLDPLHYQTMESYAQPQKQDWPVYDADQGIYVQWTPDTSHLESMLELSKDECEELRIVKIFTQRMPREYGKNRGAPVFNYKRLSISMARWLESLAQDRCTTARSRAACRWLYANNMTYREMYDMHGSV